MQLKKKKSPTTKSLNMSNSSARKKFHIVMRRKVPMKLEKPFKMIASDVPHLTLFTETEHQFEIHNKDFSLFS